RFGRRMLPVWAYTRTFDVMKAAADRFGIKQTELWRLLGGVRSAVCEWWPSWRSLASGGDDDLRASSRCAGGERSGARLGSRRRSARAFLRVVRRAASTLSGDGHRRA